MKKNNKKGSTVPEEKHRAIAEEHRIAEVLAGSRAYGMATPTSDWDRRGLFIAPPEYELGVFQRLEQAQWKQDDRVLYEIGKFAKLAVQCNPNIIELLYTEGDAIQFNSKWFNRLRQNAHLFLSKKARHTFSGYAMSQLKRIKGHNKWIENPQAKDPPAISQFCTIIWRTGQSEKPDHTIVESLHRSCFLLKTKGEYCFRIYTADDKFRPGIVSDNGTQLKYVDVDTSQRPIHDRRYKGILLTDQEAFKEARKKWSQYWEWKNNRNEKRSVLEEKHGYDCKHASHLVRLMRMAEEILSTGKVLVHRPDAEELLAIRNGSMTYKELIQWAEDIDRRLDELYEKSSLRHSPDIVGVNQLVMDIRYEYWKEHGLLA